MQLVPASMTAGLVDTSTAQSVAGVKTFANRPVLPAASLVRVGTANGYGSTNTTIRRFSTALETQGTDVTYADSATLGASFTINVAGVYSITFTDAYSAAALAGISRNTSQGATNVGTITAADRLASGTTVAADANVTLSVTRYLAAGDVIRPHTSGGTSGATPAHSQMTVARVG